MGAGDLEKSRGRVELGTSGADVFVVSVRGEEDECSSGVNDTSGAGQDLGLASAVGDGLVNAPPEASGLGAR